MTNAEVELDWLIRHRGEPATISFLNEASKKIDAEIVEETLCHIWAGFYDAEPVKELLAEQVCKNCYAIRRERKISESRRHYQKLCAKKGAN